MALINIAAIPVGSAADVATIGVSTFNLDAANDRFGCRAVVNLDRTLSKVTFYVSLVVGIMAATDLVCEIYAVDAAGKPTGAALESSNTLTGGAPAAAGEIEFTGFSGAWTKGVQYCAMVKNTNADPVNNHVRLLYPSSGCVPSGTAGYSAVHGPAALTSADGGTTHTIAGVGTIGAVFTFSDSSKYGFLAATISLTDLYDTREVGIKMTTPAGATMNAIGVVFHTNTDSGTPTGKMICSIRRVSDGSLLGTTHAHAEDPTTGNAPVLLFETPIAIPASTAIYIVVRQDASGGSPTHSFQIRQWDLPTSGQGLLPFGIVGVTFDGSVWAETAGTLPGISMLLDTTPLTAESSGSGGGVPRLLGYRIANRR